jgi:hypothetical protein
LKKSNENSYLWKLFRIFKAKGLLVVVFQTTGEKLYDFRWLKNPTDKDILRRWPNGSYSRFRNRNSNKKAFKVEIANLQTEFLKYSDLNNKQ